MIERNGFFLVSRESETHGGFHLLRAKKDFPHSTTFYIAADPHGVVYQPLHPSVTPADVLGATYAYDTGTHWKFAHCSPQEQTDLAAEVEQFIFDEFTESVLAAELEPSPAATLALRTGARYKAKAIKKFARAAGRHAHGVVVGAWLGKFHRDPHRDHKRELAVEAIDAVLTAWATASDGDRALDRTRVSNAVLAVKHRLQSRHNILFHADWHTPTVAAGIDDFTAVAGGTGTVVDLASKFRGRTALVYTATSDTETVAAVAVNGASLTVTPLIAGTADVTVRATGSKGHYVEQTFAVTVADQ